MNRMSSNDMSLIISLIESLAEVRNSCDIRLLQYEKGKDFILNVNTVFVCQLLKNMTSCDTIFNHLNYQTSSICLCLVLSHPFVPFNFSSFSQLRFCRKLPSGSPPEVVYLDFANNFEFCFLTNFITTFNLIFNFLFRDGKYFNANLKLIRYKLSTVFSFFFVLFL